MPEESATFARASLLCASPTRNVMLGSSRDVGWSSLLVDHQEGRGEADPYEKSATPDVCITVAVAGVHEVSVLRGGRWVGAVCQPGGVSVTRAGSSDRLRWRSRRPHATFATASLYVPQALFDEAADHFRRPGQPSIPCVTSELLLTDVAVASTAVALLHAMRSGADDLYAEDAARWLATHLVWVNRGRHDADVRSAGLISDARLARVVERMTAESARRWTVAELAGVAGVSPFHFNRLFQRAVGTTPQRFLTEHRMRTARRLLECTDLSVGEVAKASGYALPTAFATAFSRTFGMAPSEWRRAAGQR